MAVSDHGSVLCLRISDLLYRDTASYQIDRSGPPELPISVEPCF